VFPIPDREIGHRIGAAVVPRSTTQRGLVDKAALSDALAGRIAPFKMPHQVFVLDRLPKNANGKTQRSAVARMTLQRHP
jgi:acyl-coenzyme A synthetase/AMP-(fatty) acid ligase